LTQSQSCAFAITLLIQQRAEYSMVTTRGFHSRSTTILIDRF
jgi:hypothetical protein